MKLKSKTIPGTLDGPHLLITAGVHGDEFEGIAAIRQLAQSLETDTLAGRVTLVPVVNENAFMRGHRCADDSLDLARTFPGNPQGTVTERTAAGLTSLIRSADYYIDLHSGGTTLTVSPLVGYMLHSEPAVLASQRRMARAFNLPVIWGTSPNLEGRSLSVARDAGIPAIYAEYHGSAVCSPDGVHSYIDGCLNVMAELGMVQRDQPASRVSHVLEDDRADSGHMQIQNPSPCDGYFEPAVRLGDHVVEGQLLGNITDALGETVVSVEAPAPGMVLVLRTFPSVREGDSLAAILETGSLK